MKALQDDSQNQQKKQRQKKKMGFQFSASPPPDSGRARDHRGSCEGFCLPAGVNRGAERTAQKTEDLSTLCFYFSPTKKKRIQIPFLRICMILFFSVHPLVAYRLQKQSRCTWGLKDQQRSPSHPTHSVEVILDFSVFFSSNTIQ